jgi:hypothetical protein
VTPFLRRSARFTACGFPSPFAYLAFGVMRSHFHLGNPKGTYCCAQCTLAVYPVLRAGALRYLAYGPLALQIGDLVRKRQWRFARALNPAMLRWALGERR